MSSDPPDRPPAPRPVTVPATVQAAQARAVASVPIGEGGRPVLPSERAGTKVVGVHARQPSKSPASEPAPKKEVAFFPLEPRTWQESGLDAISVGALVLRWLVGAKADTGRAIADAVRLPLGLVREVLDEAKDRKLVTHRGTTVVGDFVWEITDAGREAALASRKMTHYAGPAPVPFEHYVQSLEYQSLSKRTPTVADLERAFADLHVSEEMFERLGPAVTSARALFLHGEPGNGKTSLAERMTRCFGGAVWIPFALDIGGNIVQLFDPSVHREIEPDPELHKGRDRRWVRIERPTVVAGGELTLDMLEIRFDPNLRIGEAPLQLKANLGTLVIDDFGRGTTKPRELLNRWIFPLERRRDFLALPDGRKVSCPFDCLLVFSTNLEPRDLVDEAFLRRIPYKIYVGDPLEDEFEQLVERVAEQLGVQLQPRAVKYLIDRHYKLPKRPMRMCHPRDLLTQVVHLCAFEGRPAVVGPPEWDRVVQNYFGI
jgi:hypothetical protein